MQTIEIKDPPFLIGETPIAEIQVSEVGFQAFIGATIVNIRQQGGNVTGDEYRKRVYRERIKAQSRFLDAGKKAVPLTDEALIQLPIPYAKKLYAAIDVEEAKAGEVTTKGDGVTTPIVFTLGTPIQIKGKAPITELEFMAKTFGDIENVMHQQTEFEQALALLSSVARPLGSDATFLALPSWAVAGITVPDGVTIAQQVLPSFLE